MNFILGLILIAIGIALIKYRYVVYDFTGEWWWATTYLWGNGTIVAIVMIGMFLIGLGTAYPFGVVDLGMQNGTQVVTPNAWR